MREGQNIYQNSMRLEERESMACCAIIEQAKLLCTVKLLLFHDGTNSNMIVL